MKNLLILFLCMLAATFTIYAQGNGPLKDQFAILYPKNKQKVRGACQISGKAKPGAVVKVQLSSSYFKRAYDNREHMFKGDGPISRINRSYTVTAGRDGRWQLKTIEFLNAGWEETYTIQATSDGKTVRVQVYDNTLPVRID